MSDHATFSPATRLPKGASLVPDILSRICGHELLYNLTIPILRHYEDYSWMESWIGRLFISHRSRQGGMREAF